MMELGQLQDLNKKLQFKILPTTILVTFGTLESFSAGPIHYKQNKTLYLVQKTWYRSCLTSC